MKLTQEVVREIFFYCMFKKEEIVDGKPIVDAVIAEGIVAYFGFHPERLKESSEKIAQLIDELPEDITQGITFLYLCNDKHGNQWGEHEDMEQLVALGIATEILYYPMPREIWVALPGGVPYVMKNVA